MDNKDDRRRSILTHFQNNKAIHNKRKTEALGLGVGSQFESTSKLERMGRKLDGSFKKDRSDVNHDLDETNRGLMGSDVNEAKRPLVAITDTRR